MAGVEPYSPCPCGSGQKFKWCCHKVESFAIKAQRLHDGGQVEAAVRTLDEGLAKEPGNPWLLTRKAVIQIREGHPEPAKATLREVLRKNPKHFGALILLTRCVLETEGPLNGAGMFQQVLGSVDEAQRPQLASLARVVALLLAEARLIPAALKHLELVFQLGDPERAAISAIRSLEGNPGITPWQKERLIAAPAPTDLDPGAASRFEEGLRLASTGLWAPAAGLFYDLAAHDPGGAADYNLGLCRLWLGDQEGAVAPLRRRSRRLGDSTEAVDLEALVHQIEPIHPDDRVEHVQLTWPLRDRDALLATLRSQDDIFDEGPASEIDEDAEGDTFALLDRPLIDKHDGKGLTTDQIPRTLGRIIVENDVAALQTYDDGRVDSLGDRFTALAGKSIAPAHPRTKVLGSASRSELTLDWEWMFPEGMSRSEAERLDLEQRVRSIRDLWPVTPSPSLGFRTPEKAARDGDASVPLRALIRHFEQNKKLEKGGLDFVAFRRRLGLDPEPAIDPETVDVDRLHLSRLDDVPADRLDDDRLVRFYYRARRSMTLVALEAAARAIIDRPAIFEKNLADSVVVYSDLASLAAAGGEDAEARDLLDRGRQVDPPARRAANAPFWDMAGIKLRVRAEGPESWVPDLAIILDRYGEDQAAIQIIIRGLVELGLVRFVPNPDDPQDVLLDSRTLQALLAEFGPRVTTASGRLGVSATRPDVWTPGSTAGGSGGGIWTPGSGSAGQPPGDKPKLILPGR